MPNLEDLFRERIIDRGPNQGKTAEEAYAIRDSKARDIASSNPFINAVSAAGGGPVKLFDVVGVLNKRRKGSIRLSESPAEVEQMGLKQFAISGRPFIYGGDIFRITNQRTRTLTLMNRAAEKGVSGGIDDKIGNAVGNYASDAVTNLLSGKRELPPKPDLVALGTELAIDVADRALGALLPNPMVPTKVAEEFEKGRNKSKVDFIDEFDTPKKILKLNSQKKVPKFVDGLLKNNKNILSQTKDFLISTAASVVGGLVKAGVTSLVRGATNLIVGKKLSNILLGPQANNATQPNVGLLRYSSRTPYSKVSAFEVFKPLNEQTGLKARYFITGIEQLKARGVKIPTNGTAAPTDLDLINAVNKEPNESSDVYDAAKTSMYIKRGMSAQADTINLSADITYDGEAAVDATTLASMDSFDFIALKFYSIYQNKTVQFRCTVTQLTENFSPTWDTNKFIGNPFNFYTYQGIERSVTFSFKVFSLNLAEHINAWERLNFLAKLTYPQDYKGSTGAVAPPLIKFTLGNMYDRREAFIDSLSFSIDENTPWEVGMNTKLVAGNITKNINGGYNAVIDSSVTAENFKLPMIVNVDITLKFVESRDTTSSEIYGYLPPVRTAPTTP
jgi:hypothetical protein